MSSNYEKYLKDPPGRHMRYPYTLTAKFVQFPYKFQFQSSYTFRYGVIGVAISSAIFWYLNRFIMTPENYEYTQRKRAEEYHFHYKRP